MDSVSGTSGVAERTGIGNAVAAGIARRRFVQILFGTIALAAGSAARPGMGQQVLYDQYGNPVAVDQYGNPVPPPTAGATGYYPPPSPYGPAGVYGQSRRGARRTARRTGRRRDDDWGEAAEDVFD